MSSDNDLTVLTIGDPHFRSRYTRTTANFVKQILALIDARQPDLVVVLGDTLHDHEQTREVCHTAAVNWFKAMAERCPVYVLIGNHDRPDNGHFLTENHFFNGIKGFNDIFIIDKPRYVARQKGRTVYRFVFVPYVEPGRFREALEYVQNDRTIADRMEQAPPNAIFAHQEFKGVHMGAIVSEHGDEWTPEDPLVISGHVHEYQQLGENIIYTGTPYQTTYAEDNNKGVFFFTFGKTVNATRCKLGLRVKQTVSMTTDEFREFNIPKGDNIDLRIKVTGSKEEVEGIKRSGIYKKVRNIPWIKLVLQPTFAFKNTSARHAKRSYLDVLYTEVCEKPALSGLYKELLGELVTAE